MEITIITGLSGAGKSVAIKSLEDLGYFCVDNFPPSLLLKMVELCSQGASSLDKLAAVIDVRGGEFFRDLNHALEELDRGNIPYQIIFLEADDDTLVRRFKETRRAHPLHSEGGILESIAKERDLLQGLRARAHVVIDTSRSSVHQLREQIMNRYQAPEAAESLEMSLISFGYKYGLPLDADMVFDLRFLPNPFWIDELRERDGTDPAVREYVLGQPESEEFLSRLHSLILYLKDRFVREGRRYVTLAMGCTGGRHRSVVLVEELARRLRDAGVTVSVRHRDVARE
ncbi:RNase adapter RapZ [Candidatus Solincola tengchongensis]|uniref:RNase adapter RapZ n=1 Tax=Candidatus Solincola tengchongensis TaxID=2900693 RepID=UPI0026E593BA|nr:RNase adapter RapZ [Candidatus Solincola tengchongensis]